MATPSITCLLQTPGETWLIKCRLICFIDFFFLMCIRVAFDAIMAHSRAEDLMNLVVIESKEGQTSNHLAPKAQILFFIFKSALEPSTMMPMWSIEKHGGAGGSKRTRRVSFLTTVELSFKCLLS